MKEAEAAYQEALATYRALAQANPEAYLPNVAMTLNNLAVLYSETQRMKEAEEFCSEAEKALNPLWARNPVVHGDQMGRILATSALLCERRDQPNENACVLAQRAFEAAYDPNLKRAIQAFVDRFC